MLGRVQMMSIGGPGDGWNGVGHALAAGWRAVASAAATAPAVVPPTVAPVAGGGEPGWVDLLVLAWAVLGLAAAWGLGAFGRRGIEGPERLAVDESAWPLLGILGVGFLATIPTAIVAGVVLGSAGRLGARWASPNLTQLAAAAASDLVAAAVVVTLLWQRRPDGAGLRLAGLDPRRLGNAVAGGTAALFVLFPLVVLASALVKAVYQAFHLHDSAPHPVLQMMGADHSPAVLAAGVFVAVVVAPVAEELAFRGLLQTMLARLFAWAGEQAGWSAAPPPPAAPPPSDRSAVPVARWPSVTPPAARWAAVVVTSAVFAGVHYGVEPAAVFPLFVLSLGLGFVYERSGNLYMNMATHGLFNGAQIALFLAVGGG